jgi:uncharacterized protein (TIGR02996 family)
VTEEDALVAGIAANPLDDLRRLVYADWLDDRGRSEQAEYLRLVAALAAHVEAIEVTHPHAVRLVELASHLDANWRVDVGSRFDLWFDPPIDAAHKIAFIKLVREATCMGLLESKLFSESLPKVLRSAVTLDAAVLTASRFDPIRYQSRIQPTAEVPATGLLRRSVELYWSCRSELVDGEWVPRTSLADTRAALAFMRGLLASAPESAHFAAGIPSVVTEPLEQFAVTLSSGLLVGDVFNVEARWQKLLLGDSTYRDGSTADPPFCGGILVQASRRADS